MKQLILLLIAALSLAACCKQDDRPPESIAPGTWAYPDTVLTATAFKILEDSSRGDTGTMMVFFGPGATSLYAPSISFYFPRIGISPGEYRVVSSPKASDEVSISVYLKNAFGNSIDEGSVLQISSDGAKRTLSGRNISMTPQINWPGNHNFPISFELREL
jgi:hypothetical protein